MAKSLIDKVLDSIFDAEWTGRRGEKLTERELKLVNFMGRKGKVLRNIYIPKDNDETSEVDVVYITQKGIFVFESKNYSGWIFGDEKNTYWTASLPGGQKNRFYNPIRQNRTHVKWLRKYIGDRIPLFSVIVFSERCEMKKVSVTTDDVKVIKRDRIYATVRKIWNNTEDVLSDEDVGNLFGILQPLTDVDEATKAAHVSRIKENYGKRSDAGRSGAGDRRSETTVKAENARPEPQIHSETQPEKEPCRQEETTPGPEPSPQPEPLPQLTCPRCGKPLVLRTAKKGTRAGGQFYGCSGFPGCRYTQQLEG